MSGKKKRFFKLFGQTASTSLPNSTVFYYESAKFVQTNNNGFEASLHKE